MIQAKRSDDWDHTATLWCLTANINRDTKKYPQAIGFESIHPFWKAGLKDAEPEATEEAQRSALQINRILEVDPQIAEAMIEAIWQVDAP